MNNLEELTSLECERHALSGLFNNPKILSEIDVFYKDDDFQNKCHRSIFSIAKQTLLANERLEAAVIAQKLINLGVKFLDQIPIFDYIETIYFQHVNAEGGIANFKELSKLRIRRELWETAKKVSRFVRDKGELKLSEIVSGCDEIYNSKIGELIKNDSTVCTDIYENIEDTIEEIGNNPPDDSKFMMGPFDSVNKLFGSLHRPGAITVIASRSGVGKTSLGMYMSTYIAEKYNIPICHADNGEMDIRELQFRSVCMFTKGEVPYFALETGKWRNNPRWEKLVREVWPRVKKIKFYYINISGLTPKEVITALKRIIYSKIGRITNDGLPKAVIHYDYLKSFDTTDYKNPEWLQVGLFIQEMKNFLLDLGLPLWASLQQNRTGITTGKTSSTLVEDEGTLGISDKILQQSTHSFILRNSLLSELQQQGPDFGNLKLKCLKHRHLGEDFQSVLTPVKVEKNKYEKNYVNIKGSSFHFEDKGDLKYMVEKLKDQHNIQDSHDDHDAQL